MAGTERLQKGKKPRQKGIFPQNRPGSGLSRPYRYQLNSPESQAKHGIDKPPVVRVVQIVLV
jgi:hypothetical protein